MTKTGFFIVAFLAAILNVSMYSAPYNDLLNEDDYTRMQFDESRGPALSASRDDQTPYWESFNQWQCFQI